MLGAIAGDIIGSIYEREPIKTTEFPLFGPNCQFTDDTVLTVAVAECLLTDSDYTDTFVEYFDLYPSAGFGGSFYRWASEEWRRPYNSFGNGSAMRVSPIGWAMADLDEVLAEARRSAEVTHNHPEGIKGAQAVAAAVFLARTGASKAEIRGFVESTFGYNLDVPIEMIRPGYRFDVSCQGTVPPAIRAFLEAENYEVAVRLAISLGGDSDTLACITGAISHAFYGALPPAVSEGALTRLDDRLRTVVHEFSEAFNCPL